MDAEEIEALIRALEREKAFSGGRNDALYDAVIALLRQQMPT